MHLTEWACRRGIHPQTACNWFRAGTLAVPGVRVNQWAILVSPDAALSAPTEALGLYARVSSHSQHVDSDPLVARLSCWAAQMGHPVIRVEAEVGSGVRGSWTKLRRLLAAPNVSTVVVERRDRLAAVNVELVEAALSAHGRRLVVVDEGEVDDDLVEDMTELLTSFCARLYGRCSARNRAEKALRGAEHDVGPMAVAQEAPSVGVLSERMGIATPSHMCGPAVMGTEPVRSVPDPQCRLHDVANLSITDASCFPSSTAVNPALPIAANALRVTAIPESRA